MLGEHPDEPPPGLLVVSLNIADTGEGIQPEALKRIWEPFPSATNPADLQTTAEPDETARHLTAGSCPGPVAAASPATRPRPRRPSTGMQAAAAPDPGWP